MKRYFILIFITLSLLGINARCQVIFAVGNSITLSTPIAAKGWDGNWGMAASCVECDYVGQLAKELSQTFLGQRQLSMRFNASQLERDPKNYDIKKIFAACPKKPDILIYFLGDNISDTSEENLSIFVQKLVLAHKLLPPQLKHVIVVGTWWHNNSVDTHLKDFASKIGADFVSLAGLRKNPVNIASLSVQYSDSGVRDHPSDDGMKIIANKIREFVAPRDY